MIECALRAPMFRIHLHFFCSNPKESFLRVSMSHLRILANENDVMWTVGATVDS